MKIDWHPNSQNPGKTGVHLRCLQPMMELQARGLDVSFYDINNPFYTQKTQLVKLQLLA